MTLHVLEPNHTVDLYRSDTLLTPRSVSVTWDGGDKRIRLSVFFAEHPFVFAIARNHVYTSEPGVFVAAQSRVVTLYAVLRWLGVKKENE